MKPFELYEKLKDKSKHSFLLESPNANNKLEEYSFIGLDPSLIIDSSKIKKNIFNYIKSQLRTYDLRLTTYSSRFSSGLVGYINYNAGRFIENLPDIAKDDLQIPDILMMIPKTLIIFDHRKDEIKIIAEDKKRKQEIEKIISEQKLNDPSTTLRVQTQSMKLQRAPSGAEVSGHWNLTKPQFMNMVTKAKEYIAKGDIYQVNLSQRYQTKLNQDPWEIYKRLRIINPSPFAAYLNFGDIKIASCSPERLILLENSLAQTRPIAGTRRSIDKVEDLILNEKERAEHIMLVDLERNDLGKVCEYGTVEVDEKMIVEKYSHVMHIVSNVKGKLKKDKDQFDLFKAMFPGGTITGTPKIRSMEIIEELEPIKRGPYTGCIGYFGFNGNMDMSITIRTIVCKENKAYIQVGAGIVADSDPEKEYFETLHKAEAMLQAISNYQ